MRAGLNEFVSNVKTCQIFCINTECIKAWIYNKSNVEKKYKLGSKLFLNIKKRSIKPVSQKLDLQKYL